MKKIILGTALAVIVLTASAQIIDLGEITKKALAPAPPKAPLPPEAPAPPPPPPSNKSIEKDGIPPLPPAPPLAPTPPPPPPVHLD